MTTVSETFGLVVGSRQVIVNLLSEICSSHVFFSRLFQQSLTQSLSFVQVFKRLLIGLEILQFSKLESRSDILTNYSDIDEWVSSWRSLKVNPTSVDSLFQGIDLFDIKIGRSISPVKACSLSKASIFVTPTLTIFRAFVSRIVTEKKSHVES